MSRNVWPPGMKISLCVGRSAPPDSTRLIERQPVLPGDLASRAAFLRIVIGLLAPPRTVGSLAISMHSTPSTTPMPVTRPAPTGNVVPHAASGDSSRNGDSWSSIASIRSRASSLPRSAMALDVLRPAAAVGDRQLLVVLIELGEHRVAVAAVRAGDLSRVSVSTGIGQCSSICHCSSTQDGVALLGEGAPSPRPPRRRRTALGRVLASRSARRPSVPAPARCNSSFVAATAPGAPARMPATSCGDGSPARRRRRA